MKNAGMAGAVALVGIGLLSIGLGEKPLAATTKIHSAYPDRPALKIHHDSKEKASAYRAKCGIVIFEHVLRPYDTTCIPGDEYRWRRQEARVDLLGIGTPQLVRGGYVNTYDFCDGTAGPQDSPIQIALPTGIKIVELDFSPDGPLEFEAVFGFLPCAVAVAGYLDVDLDGRPDLILNAGGEGPRALGWLRNIYDGPARLPADLNDDGRVDGADLGELFVQWTG